MVEQIRRTGAKISEAVGDEDDMVMNNPISLQGGRRTSLVN